MSTVVAEPRERPAPEEPGVRFEKRRRHSHRLSDARERVALFAVFYALYVVVGYFTIVRWHVVVGDAHSRLAHAYFVWWNAPGKLVAIGFVWPPLQTLVFLPVALIKPLATSLIALPVTSGLFAAGTLVVLERTLALVGLRRVWRLVLVALFGLNPMYVFYSSNGMAEVVYLFLLALAFYWLLRWHLGGGAHFLLLSGTAFALGTMVRYEVIEWACLAAVFVAAALRARGAGRSEIEGSFLSFFAPIVYTVGLWIFFNWIILGRPLYFVQIQGALKSHAVGVDIPPPPTPLSPGELVGTVASLTWHLFPLTLVVAAALIAVCVRRRDAMSGMLAAALLLNPLTTAALVYRTNQHELLELRYNIRSMPLALIGVAWLYYRSGTRIRPAVLLGATALLVLTLPLAWRTMQSYPQQVREQAFTRALASRHTQEGTLAVGPGGLPVPVGFKPSYDMAHYITAHVRQRNAVLTDDAQTFGTVLRSGRPDLFFDRIDRGEAGWLVTARQPYRTVRYLLISDQRPDRLRQMYPDVTGPASRGLRLVYATSRERLFAVVGRTQPHQ
jgi:hypothetical protein